MHLFWISWNCLLGCDVVLVLLEKKIPKKSKFVCYKCFKILIKYC